MPASKSARLIWPKERKFINKVVHTQKGFRIPYPNEKKIPKQAKTVLGALKLLDEAEKKLPSIKKERHYHDYYEHRRNMPKATLKFDATKPVKKTATVKKEKAPPKERKKRAPKPKKASPEKKAESSPPKPPPPPAPTAAPKGKNNLKNRNLFGPVKPSEFKREMAGDLSVRYHESAAHAKWRRQVQWMKSKASFIPPEQLGVSQADLQAGAGAMVRQIFPAQPGQVRQETPRVSSKGYGLDEGLSMARRIRGGE